MRRFVLARFAIFGFIALVSIGIIILDVILPVLSSNTKAPIGLELSLFACGPVTLVIVATFLFLESLKKRPVIPIGIEAALIIFLTVFWLVIGILTTSNPPNQVDEGSSPPGVTEFSCAEFTVLDVLPFLIVAATLIWAIGLRYWSRHTDYWRGKALAPVPQIPSFGDPFNAGRHHRAADSADAEEIQLLPQSRGGKYGYPPNSRTRGRFPSTPNESVYEF